MTVETIHLNYSWNEVGFSVHYKVGDKDTWHLFDLYKKEVRLERTIIELVKKCFTDTGKFLIGNETRINVMQDD